MKLKIFVITSILTATTFSSERNSSDLTLNISVKKSEINRVVNKEVPDVFEGVGNGEQLFNGKVFDLGLNLLGNVDKKIADYTKEMKWAYRIERGDININAKADNLVLNSDYTGIFKLNLIEQNENIELKLKGNIELNSRVNISNNWDFQLETTPNFFIENEKFPLKLNLFGFNITKDIDAGKTVQTKLNSALKNVSKKFDEKIVESIDLRKNMIKLLEILKKPILIDEKNSIWLTINPILARYSEFSMDEENIKFGIGSQLETALYVGDEPKIDKKIELPQITYGILNNSSEINLPIILSYKKINEIVNREDFEKKVDIFWGIKADFNNIELAPNQNKISLTSDVVLKLFGIFNLKGNISGNLIPVRNENGEFVKNTIEYYLKTDNWFLKGMNKLFKNKIINSIEKNKYLNLNQSEKNNELKEEFQVKLNKIGAEKEPKLSVNIKEIKMEDIRVKSGDIRVLLRVRGDFYLDIRKLTE